MKEKHKEKHIKILEAYFANDEGPVASYRAMGEAIGVSHETVRRWMLGETRPTLDSLEPVLTRQTETNNQRGIEIILNILAARYPHLFAPVGEIGTRVLVSSPPFPPGTK